MRHSRERDKLIGYVKASAGFQKRRACHFSKTWKKISTNNISNIPQIKMAATSTKEGPEYYQTLEKDSDEEEDYYGEGKWYHQAPS